MSRLRSNDFLTDLYRDLRDRRLLLPLAALGVMIVAVPFLLKGESTEPALSTAAPIAPEEAESAQSAVLLEQTGIRDYRKRLAALKKKNPFKQQYTKVSEGDRLAEPSASASAPTTEPVSTSLDDATATGGDTSGATGTTAATGTSSGGDGSSDGGSSQPVSSPTPVAEPPKVKVKVKKRFYTYRADVTIGPLGETKKINGVKRFQLLPGENKPVVAFLGATVGGKRGVFMVSPDVERTDGEGVCSPPDPDRCMFLTLKIGSQQYLHYTPDGKVYRLKLRDIEVRRIANPERKK